MIAQCDTSRLISRATSGFHEANCLQAVLGQSRVFGVLRSPAGLLQTVLEHGGSFAGVNRKVQLKPLRWAPPEEGSQDAPRIVEALLILKHGGVLTHAGRQQVCPASISPNLPCRPYHSRSKSHVKQKALSGIHCRSGGGHVKQKVLSAIQRHRPKEMRIRCEDFFRTKGHEASILLSWQDEANLSIRFRRMPALHTMRVSCSLRSHYFSQAEALGNVFRTVMYPRYGPAGGGLLRLHSTYRHDLKIYSSDEGRVQTSAAAFTQGLLDLEGDSLTPILVRYF